MAAAACGSSASAGSANSEVVARLGDLEIIHPFLPSPASPSVAAVYLTVRNTGTAPDRLTGISTPAAASSMLMAEEPTGAMAPLVDLEIPAHGEASLAPGHDHLMLENPTSTFKVGQEVRVTLRFAQAGSIAVEVPVVPLTDIVGGSGSTSMGKMPGM